MPDNRQAPLESGKFKKMSAIKSYRSKRPNKHLSSAFDIRRFFMPNVDKIVKNVMHEISDGKSAVRETMSAALRNQEIVIAQNKRLIDLLEQISAKLAHARDAAPALPAVEPAALCPSPLQNALAEKEEE